MLLQHRAFPTLSLDCGSDDDSPCYYGYELNPEDLKLLFQFPISTFHSDFLSISKKNDKVFTDMIIKKCKESPSVFQCFITGEESYHNVRSLSNQLDDLGVNVLHQHVDQDSDGVCCGISYTSHWEEIYRDMYSD